MGVNLVFLKGAELTEQGLLASECRGPEGTGLVSSLPESPPGQDGPEHQTSTLGK